MAPTSIPVWTSSDFYPGFKASVEPSTYSEMLCNDIKSCCINPWFRNCVSPDEKCGV